MLAKDYLQRAQGPSYKIINEIIGVLECVKLEFYRRIAAPYENDKQQANGDVYYPLDTSTPQSLDYIVIDKGFWNAEITSPINRELDVQQYGGKKG